MSATQRGTPARRWVAALAGVGLISVGVFAIVGGSRTSAEPVDLLEPVVQVEDVEACDTTVYEGCPQRWDYLLTQD